MRSHITLTLALFAGWYGVLLLCLFVAQTFAVSAMPHDLISHLLSMILVAIPAVYAGWRAHQFQLIDTEEHRHIATRIAVQAVQLSIGLIIGIYIGFTSVDALVEQGWQMVGIVKGLIVLVGLLIAYITTGLFAYLIAKPCVLLFLPK